MNDNMKRRDFLVLAGAGFLSACGGNGGSSPPSPTLPPASSAKPPATSPPTSTSRSPPATPPPPATSPSSSPAPSPPAPPATPPPQGSNTIATENALAGQSDWVLTQPDSSQIE